jgi:hypothetical protein
MKTGLIVYVVGREPADWNADLDLLSIRQNMKADLVEIITAETGHFDVPDAWCSLLVRGMKRIVCMMGEFAPSGNLTLTGRELRLCG